MIWLRSFILTFAVVHAVSGVLQQQSYLLYASENKNSIEFYETDFQLSNPQKFLTINNDVGVLNNLFISPSDDKKVMYWKYNESTSVYRYDLVTKEQMKKEFSEESTSDFLGLGNNDQLYLYSTTTKILKVYDFETGNKLSQIESLKDVPTDMHCVDVDPRFREQLFFAECSKKNFTGKVLDVNLKALQSYSQPLPKCFKTWRITPDAKLACAVKGKSVYISFEEGKPFSEYYKAKGKILGFAAGNNELFYSTKNGTLVKVNITQNNNGFSKKIISTPPTVNKLALRQYK